MIRGSSLQKASVNEQASGPLGVGHRNRERPRLNAADIPKLATQNSKVRAVDTNPNPPALGFVIRLAEDMTGRRPGGRYRADSVSSAEDS